MILDSDNDFTADFQPKKFQFCEPWRYFINLKGPFSNFTVCV